MLSVIFIGIVAPYFFPLFVTHKQYDYSEFEKEIAALEIVKSDSVNNYSKKMEDDFDAHQPYYQPSESSTYTSTQPWKGTLFYFDPNTLDVKGWQKLGVKDKTIGTIKNYLSKGGKFYKPEDIKKIWGLQEELAEKLIPYIQIPPKEFVAKEKPVFEKKTYTAPLVDINSADTGALTPLPGIGSKLALRIINFRDKLGGFYSVEQVAETYGLPDSTFQKIKLRLVVHSNAVKQININTASLDELKAHPYIRYAMGNAIIQYRTQHGNFEVLTDVQKVMPITQELFNKIQPYLKL